ncbi:hypothetical protein DY000_02038790 [Brassica cretica]|uniref:Essential protein Yae1 N-terminal domain-containing protein n=1 Tax=Brassica cretica TaxID=69181 RepID=A0ABQ7BCN0_BRACR|nr:hypothetical protein DY000_02038790 [Brassica cretica]
MVYTTIAPRNKVQEIIIDIMEIVSGNNQNRNKELPSWNQLEYLIDEWGRRRRRIGDGVLRSNRRALFSTEWKEEKREMDKMELEINAKDAGDCRHLDFCISFMILAGKDAGGLEEENLNIGFKESVLEGYNFGFVRGVSSALALLSEELKENLIDEEEARDKFQKLHNSIACSLNR